MIHQIHPNKVRQVLFLVVIIFLGLIIAKEMFFLLGGFLGAITIYVLTRNLFIHLVVDRKWRRGLAALLIMLASFIIIVLPFAFLTKIVIDKVTPFLQDPGQINTYFTQINNYLLQKFNLNLLNEKNIGMINTKLISLAQNTIGQTASTLGNIFLMYFILYFLLTGTDQVERWMRKNAPFKHHNVAILLKEIKQSIYGNAVGIPIVALAQGFLGMIGYLVFGIDEWLVMGVLTFLTSMIPVVGAMIIYIPLALYELSHGHTWQGIGIAVWGFILIGSIDNVLRLYLQKQMNDVHPLMTIFGVIIGVPLFGFLGVIFGPLILSLFFLLVKVYADEFGKAEVERE